MALRLYTRSEFEEELRSVWDLEQTEHGTATTTIWKAQNGANISVPPLTDGELYPHCLLGDIAEHVRETLS